MKNIQSLVFLSLLMMLSVSIHAQDVDKIKVETSTLECGDAIIIGKITYLETSDYFTQVLEQRLIWRDIKSNKQKILKNDARYVIKHLPKKYKVLDAALQAWGCKKSKQGKYYFWLFYYCTFGEEKGFCAQGPVEFIRYLNEDGSWLIKARRRWISSSSDEAIYKHLGLEDKTSEVVMKNFSK